MASHYGKIRAQEGSSLPLMLDSFGSPNKYAVYGGMMSFASLTTYKECFAQRRRFNSRHFANVDTGVIVLDLRDDRVEIVSAQNTIHTTNQTSACAPFSVLYE